MTRYCRRSALVLILLLTLSGYSCSGEKASEQEAKKVSPPGQQEKKVQLRWLGFNEGLAKARVDNKPILLDFYTDWCVYCKKLDKETFQDPAVSTMLAENFVTIRLNAESSKQRLVYRGKTFTNIEFSRYFGVTAYPSLAFLDAGGQPVTMIPGFVPPTHFLVILNYMHQKCYLSKVSLHEFFLKGDCN
jgi:thioredoxin-related protein